MRFLAIAAVACALIGCVKSDPKPKELETHADDAPVAAPAADANAAGQTTASKVDCPMMLALIGSVRETRVAMNPQPAFEAALADWQAVPEDCRDGRWHALAAQLLRTGFTDKLSAGDHSFDSAERALTAGLARDPNRAELLELVAYLSLAAPDASPELPLDACDRIAATDAGDADDEATADRRHYICGHAALRNRAPRKAVTELAAVANRRVYPDLELRYAFALLRTDDRAGAKSAAEKVQDLSLQSALAFGATEAEVANLQSQAAKLVASLR